MWRKPKKRHTARAMRQSLSQFAATTPPCSNDTTVQDCFCCYPSHGKKRPGTKPDLARLTNNLTHLQCEDQQHQWHMAHVDNCQEPSYHCNCADCTRPKRCCPLLLQAGETHADQSIQHSWSGKQGAAVSVRLDWVRCWAVSCALDVHWLQPTFSGLCALLAAPSPAVPNTACPEGQPDILLAVIWQQTWGQRTSLAHTCCAATHLLLKGRGSIFFVCLIVLQQKGYPKHISIEQLRLKGAAGGHRHARLPVHHL